MRELLMIAIGSAIVNNVVLSQFLGLCPFLGVSKKINTAAGMGGAVIFVLTLSSLMTSLIYQFILVPTGMEFLQTIVFILVIAALVQLVEMFMKKILPPLLSGAGRLSSADHHKLCGAGRCDQQCAGRLQRSGGRGQRVCDCGWIYDRNRSDGRAS